MVGFSIIPTAGDESLTHHLYVSLVSFQMERVSKMCHSKLGQYHLALLNSPQEEAYEHLFEGLPGHLGLEEAQRTLLAYFLWVVCQDLHLHGL